MGFSLKNYFKTVADPWLSASNRLLDSPSKKFGSWLNDISGQTSAFEASQDATWDMWNANNAYNSPEHMMQLYKKAGLNPNMVANSAGTHSYASGSAPSMSAGGSSVLSTIASFFGMGADLALKGAQTKLLNAQANQIGAQTNLLTQEYDDNSNKGFSRSTPGLQKLSEYGKDQVRIAGEGLASFIQDNFGGFFDTVMNGIDKHILKYKDEDYVNKETDSIKYKRNLRKKYNEVKDKVKKFREYLPFSY